jgi:hypothetical protein
MSFLAWQGIYKLTKVFINLWEMKALFFKRLKITFPLLEIPVFTGMTTHLFL